MKKKNKISNQFLLNYNEDDNLFLVQSILIQTNLNQSVIRILLLLLMTKFSFIIGKKL